MTELKYLNFTNKNLESKINLKIIILYYRILASMKTTLNLNENKFVKLYQYYTKKMLIFLRCHFWQLKIVTNFILSHYGKFF